MYSPRELAEAFLQAGELEDACAALDQQLEIQPTDTEARRLRAAVLLRLPGRPRDALRDLDAIADPTPDDHLLRAQICDALGDGEGAFAALWQVWLASHDLRAADRLLQYLYRRGEIAEALLLLLQLPKTWRWFAWRGDFSALLGEDAGAILIYGAALHDLGRGEDSAIRATQRAYLLLKRAEVYRRLKRWAEADADYAAASAIIPNDPTIPRQPHPPTPSP